MSAFRIAAAPETSLARPRAAALSALAVALSLLAVALQGPSPATPDSAGGDVARGYGELPLAFAPAGAPGADFSSTTSAGSIALSADGATIVPTARGAEPVHMDLLGGAAVHPVAEQKLPGVVNDLRGSDPSRWRTEIPTFARIRYPDVYPGIALDYHGTTGTLEYDFRLAPGADPGQIGVDFNGAPVRLARSGALVVGEGLGAIRQAPPVAFQPSADGRDPVEASFRLAGDHVGFALGAYDSTRPLVIDPLVLSYSTFLGGPTDPGGGGEDAVEDVAVDSSGNAYLTGYTNAPGFPTTGGSYDQTPEGGTDVFVTKLNPTGTGLVYSTLIGGDFNDFANGIAVDGSGNTYVTGQTDSTQTGGSAKFPTTAGAYVNSPDDGSGDVFVTKLNATGSALTYSSVFGGSGTDGAHGIAIDTSGNAYVAGATSSGASVSHTALYPTTNALQATYGGNSRDAFITKLNATGTAPVFSTYLGGSGQDEALGIDLDSQGRAYVAGFSTAFSGNTFPTTAANRFAPVDVDSADAFLSRLSADGSALQYSTGIGTDGSGSNNGSDYANAVAVGADGIAYITGTSSTGSGADFPLKSQYEGRNGQCCFGNDLFVSKFDTNASGSDSLLYSTLIGGSGTESGAAIAVDGDGNAYVGGVTGNASGEKYDTTADELGGGTGRGTAIVTKVSQSGSANATLAFSTTIPNGGFGGDEVGGIAIDGAGSVYVAGVSKGNAPLQTTAGAFQATHPGSWDGFVSKISFSNDAVPPDTSITGGPGAGSTVTSNPITFNFSSTEAGSTFECSYDGAAFTPCSSPGPGTTGSDTRTLSNGAHTFLVRARDGAGNVDASPVSRTFTVSLPDTTPPDTSITGGPSGTVTSPSATFVFSSTESNSTFECSYDGAPFTACTSPGPGPTGSDTRTLANGSHTFAVRARDGAGNADASPATRTFTVSVSTPPPPDRSPPETTITDAPPNKVKSRRFPVTVELAFSASEPGSTFSCRIDSGPATGCSSPAQLKLGKGKHTISVVATDSSGNADASPATAQVEVKKKKRKKKPGGKKK